MLPEPTGVRRPLDGLAATEPSPDALRELRSGVENLLASTLTLLRQLREADRLTGPLRHQAILVAVDGGNLEATLSTVLPDLGGPTEAEMAP